MNREIFLEAARSYVDVPWRHQGRSRTGLDCIGLVIASAKDAGLEISDPAPYDREPSDSRLVQEAKKIAKRVSPPEAGDVVVFRSSKFVGHVGIRAFNVAWGRPSIIHAYMYHRAVQEDPWIEMHDDAFVAAFRLWSEP